MRLPSGDHTGHSKFMPGSVLFDTFISLDPSAETTQRFGTPFLLEQYAILLPSTDQQKSPVEDRLKGGPAVHPPNITPCVVSCFSSPPEALIVNRLVIPSD